MLDPTLLTTLAIVAREGSFERAARLLHVTPSAVSQRIRLLETMPALRPVPPYPVCFCSRIVILVSGARALIKCAVHKPVNPAPTIAMSQASGCWRLGAAFFLRVASQ